MLLNVFYFIYSNKIFYRDMKVVNVFIIKNGVLKLVDFGLVRVIYFNKE